jgi:hypothetical protein
MRCSKSNTDATRSNVEDLQKCEGFDEFDQTKMFTMTLPADVLVHWRVGTSAGEVTPPHGWQQSSPSLFTTLCASDIHEDSEWFVIQEQ